MRRAEKDRISSLGSCIGKVPPSSLLYLPPRGGCDIAEASKADTARSYNSIFGSTGEGETAGKAYYDVPRIVERVMRLVKKNSIKISYGLAHDRIQKKTSTARCSTTHGCSCRRAKQVQQRRFLLKAYGLTSFHAGVLK